jgi:hypothetical protein
VEISVESVKNCVVTKVVTGCRPGYFLRKPVTYFSLVGLFVKGAARRRRWTLARIEKIL